jgi:tRNA-2-methylthio-N6-dimethylallyladenosine synthase
MDDDLIEAHAEIPKLMPYLHLPVQSGSDHVLRAMNRKHTARRYIDLAAKVRQARSDIALSSDFIVGFPAETESDFEATLALVRQVGFAQSYSFKYSPRPGTPAADLPQISDKVKTERLQRLQSLLNAQQQAFNLSCVGRTLPVLLDRLGRHPGQLVGRSPYLQPVHLSGDSLKLGEIVAALVDGVGSNSLSAHIAGPSG